MRRRQQSWRALAIAAALTAVAAPAAHAAAGDVELLSRPSGVATSSGNGASTLPQTTRTGVATVFLSRATNLTGDSVPGTFPQAFVRDATTATTVLASVADGTPSGGPPAVPADAANAAVSDVSISDDGRYVAFHSQATNLVDGVTTAADRSYVRDLLNLRTFLVAPAGAEDAVRPVIAPGGGAIAYASHANHDGATGASLKVYVRSFSSDGPDTTTLASRKTGAAGATLTGDYPRLSADGTRVAFVGSSPTADVDFPGPEVTVRDLTATTTTVASRADGPSGAPAGSGPVGERPAFSRDGRYVAFATAATNLSDEDSDTATDVFRRDLTAGTTTLVTRATGAAGPVADGESQGPSVSDDGRLVLFRSAADDLSEADNNGGDNTFVRDLVAATTTWIHGSATQAPPPQGVMQGAALSGDGLWAVFDTNATLLTGQESGSFADVFRRDLRAPGTQPPTDGGGGNQTPGDTTPPGPTTTTTTDPKSPPAPTEHTVLGVIVWERPFSLGLYPAGESVFRSPFRDLTVDVVSPTRGSIGRAGIERPDGAPLGNADPYVPFRIDGLGDCTDGCTVRLGRPGDDGFDEQPVSFTGEAGQTTVTLMAGGHGLTSVIGTVSGPAGVRADTLGVRLRDAQTGQVLADTRTMRPRCAPRGTAASATYVGCSTEPVYLYRFDALPVRRAVVAELRQGPGSGVLVDSAEFQTGDPGATGAPQLTALPGPPNATRGRTLHGEVLLYGPYAPGQVVSGAFAAASVRDLRIVLRRGNNVLASARVLPGAVPRQGPGVPPGVPNGSNPNPTYQLNGLPACASCTLEALDGKDVVRRVTVSVPSATPSVTYEPVSLPRTGTAQFVEGSVMVSTAAAVDVLVSDAATGALIADSAHITDPTCGPGAQRNACFDAQRGRLPAFATLGYRIGKLPANRDVLVQLLVRPPSGGQGVVTDTQAVTTSDDGVPVGVPELTAPPNPRGGRTLLGRIWAQPAIAPGVTLPATPPAVASVRLVDAAGRVLLTVTPSYDRATRVTSYSMAELKPCPDCHVELLDRARQVSDSQPAAIRPETASTTFVDLIADRVSGGRWIEGALYSRKPTLPRDLHVVVFAADHRTVLADTARLRPQPCPTSSCHAETNYSWRLGGLGADVTKVIVEVRRRNEKLASTVAEGPADGGDIYVPYLSIDPPTRRR